MECNLLIVFVTLVKTHRMNSPDHEIEFKSPFNSSDDFSTSEKPHCHEEEEAEFKVPNPSRIQAGLAPLNFRSSRRGSVSAESYQPLRQTATTTAVTSPVNFSENARKAVKNNFLFKSLDQEQLTLVFRGMAERNVKAGDLLIEQGQEGDNFYIVEAGKYAVEVDGKEVVQIGPGGSFGELALMYNAPRAASVRALEDGILYAVDRITFRRVIIDLAHEKRCKYMDFLKSIPLLSCALSQLEIGKIADALEEVEFSSPGDIIVRQGDPGDSFYIVLDGVARVEKGGLFAGELKSGDFFGELALLNRKPRAASVLVQSAPLKCLRLAEGDFVRLLGSLKNILLRRSIHQYDEHHHVV